MAKRRFEFLSNRRNRIVDGAIAAGVLTLAAAIYFASTDTETRNRHRTKAADLGDRFMGFVNGQADRLDRFGVPRERVDQATKAGRAVVHMLRPEGQSFAEQPAPGDVPISDQPQAAIPPPRAAARVVPVPA